MYKVVLILGFLCNFLSTQMLGCSSITDSKRRAQCKVNQYPEDFYIEAFKKFVRQFDKEYESQDETLRRYRVFKVNYQRILEHNLNENNSYQQELNQFADLEQKEFEEQYLTQFTPKELPKDAIKLGSESPVSTNVESVLNQVQKQQQQNVQRNNVQIETVQQIQKPQPIQTPTLYQNKSTEQQTQTQPQQKPVEKVVEERSSYYYRYNSKTKQIEKVYFD